MSDVLDLCVTMDTSLHSQILKIFNPLFLPTSLSSFSQLLWWICFFYKILVFAKTKGPFSSWSSHSTHYSQIILSGPRASVTCWLLLKFPLYSSPFCSAPEPHTQLPTGKCIGLYWKVLKPTCSKRICSCPLLCPRPDPRPVPIPC